MHAYTTNLRLGQRLLTKFIVRTAPGRGSLCPLLMSQAEIEAQLRRRLAELGGEARWDHEVVASAQDSNGVEVPLRTHDGENFLRAGWVA